MKLFVLCGSASAFFGGMPGFSGFGVPDASGPQTMSNENACNILPTNPTCEDCAKVGAACLGEYFYCGDFQPLIPQMMETWKTARAWASIQ